MERYLLLVGEVIRDNFDDPKRRPVGAKLEKALQRAGIEPDAKGDLQLPKGTAAQTLDPARVPIDSDIRIHLGAWNAWDQEPDKLVGAAKELVEATAKHMLLTLDIPFERGAKLPSLSKQALMGIGLHPNRIAPTAKGAEHMKRILGGLGQIAVGIADLRNLGYGVGHGQGRRIAGLQQRHAAFVARSAIAYATFVLDTLDDPSAPWRKEGQGSSLGPTAPGTP